MQYRDLQTESVEFVEDDLIFMQMKAWGDYASFTELPHSGQSGSYCQLIEHVNQRSQKHFIKWILLHMQKIP